jgi:hypothetical protein
MSLFLPTPLVIFYQLVVLPKFEKVQKTRQSVYFFIHFFGLNNNNNGALVPFDYFIDEVNKTITITGKEAGAGTVTGYFAASNGGAIQSLNIYIEYTYDLAINAPLMVKLEPDEKIYKLPFTVFPRSMTVEAFSSNNDKLQIRSISLDTRTGEGEIDIVPAGEQLNLTVTVRASNPKDPVNGVVIREQLFHVYYNDVEFDFEFDHHSGAFSYFNPDEGSAGTLHLGDGETMTFRIKTPQKHIDISNLNVTFTSPLEGSTPHARVRQGDNGGYIELLKDPPGGEYYWSLRHISDVVDYGYIVKYKLKIDIRSVYGIYFSSYEFTASNDDPIHYAGDLKPLYTAINTHYQWVNVSLSHILSPPFTTDGNSLHFLYKSNYNLENDLPLSNASPQKTFTLEWMSGYAYLTDTDPPARVVYLTSIRNATKFTIAFSYVPVTPYKITTPTLDNIRNYLPQEYYITDAYHNTYCLYDLGLLERFSDTDPAVDASYQGGLNITYTRAFDGKTYTRTVPVSIDERSCPAYMKE